MAAVSNSAATTSTTVPALQYRTDQCYPDEIEIFVPSHGVCFVPQIPIFAELRTATLALTARNIRVVDQSVCGNDSSTQFLQRKVAKYLTKDVQISKKLADLAKQTAELQQKLDESLKDLLQEAALFFKNAKDPRKATRDLFQKNQDRLEAEGRVKEIVVYDEAADQTQATAKK